MLQYLTSKLALMRGMGSRCKRNASAASQTMFMDEDQFLR